MYTIVGFSEKAEKGDTNITVLATGAWRAAVRRLSADRGFTFAAAFEGRVTTAALWEGAPRPRFLVPAETAGPFTAVGLDPAGDSSFLFSAPGPLENFWRAALDARPHGSVILIAVLQGALVPVGRAEDLWRQAAG